MVLSVAREKNPQWHHRKSIVRLLVQCLNHYATPDPWELLVQWLMLLRYRVSKGPDGIWNCVVTATESVSGRWPRIRKEFWLRNVSKIELWGSSVLRMEGGWRWLRFLTHSIFGCNCAEHRITFLELFSSVASLYRLNIHVANSTVFLRFTWEISVLNEKSAALPYAHSAELDKRHFQTK
jgi:hypothetical protein